MPIGRIKKLVFPKAFGLIETPEGKEIFFSCSRSEVGNRKVGDTICYEIVKEPIKKLGKGGQGRLKGKIRKDPK